MRIRGIAGLIFLAAMAAPAQQSQPVPNSGVVIRTEAKQVLVDAVVTDKKGIYVPDLSQKDFKVTEDGKEQSIRSFSYEAEAASSNSAQKHYLVLFFDNSTMSFSDQVVARRAAGKFVEANAGPNRYMAVVDFSGGVRIAQNFTADAERLKQVVSGAKFANVDPNAATPALGGDASTPSGPALDTGPASLSAAAEGEFGQRDLLLGMRALAKGLAVVPGRKILVLFTEGFPLNLEIRSEVTALTDTCNKANVAIYPIDVRGLVAPVGALRPAAPRDGGIFAALGLAGGYGLVQPVAYFQRGGTRVPRVARAAARPAAPGLEAAGLRARLRHRPVDHRVRVPVQAVDQPIPARAPARARAFQSTPGPTPTSTRRLRGSSFRRRRPVPTTISKSCTCWPMAPADS